MSAGGSVATADRMAEAVAGVIAPKDADSPQPQPREIAPSGPTAAAPDAADTSPTESRASLPPKRQAPAPLRDPWGQDKLRQCYPQLQEDLAADVVVVGAGLAGLSTAYRLARAGRSVVVLESRLVGSGSAGHDMGALSTWVGDTYREVERVAGLDRARQVAAAHAAAVAFVRQVVSEEGIECELTEVEGAVQVEGAEPGGQQTGGGAREVAAATAGSSSRASRTLREELAACCRAGVEGAHIEFRAVEGLPEAGAVETLVLPGCLNVQPVSYLRGLAEAVLRRGGRIFENTRAKGGIVTGPSGGVVKTMHGHVVRASDAVILATHSPINRDQLWVHDRQIPKRDYTVAIEAPRGSLPAHFSQLVALGGPTGGGLAGMFLGPTGSGRHSVRVAALPPHHLVAGEGGGGAGSSYEVNKELLLVRGAAHLQGQAEKQYGDPWVALEHWARARFPLCGRTLYRWSGSDYYPADMLGLYGRDPLDLSRPPVYILTGHGGQQWTGATLGSEVVAGEVLGGAVVPPWAEAYRPARVLPGAVAKYTSELALYFSTVAMALLKHLVPRSLQDVVGMVAPRAVERSIQAGEGRVAQHGLLKQALYRDPEGTLHRHSALCTHLGCCVEWNPLDRTFDCPCHGSQYDACGRCIHAPAVADLEDLGTRK